MLIDRLVGSAAHSMMKDVFDRSPAAARTFYLASFARAGLRPPRSLTQATAPKARPKRDALAKQIEGMRATLRKNGRNI